MNYSQMRNAYYAGIFILILYAFPKVAVIQQYVRPVLDYEIIVGLPIVSFIALTVGIAAFLAFKYRKIG